MCTSKATGCPLFGLFQAAFSKFWPFLFFGPGNPGLLFQCKGEGGGVPGGGLHLSTQGSSRKKNTQRGRKMVCERAPSVFIFSVEKDIISLNLVFNGYLQKKLCITVMGIEDLLAFESRQENLKNNLLLYIVSDILT